MDYNNNLFNGMVLFCAVVEQNGMTAAAKKLGHTPSHVSKEIARLEHRLGVRLLNRTTRKISLTETGSVYYEHVRHMITDAGVVETRMQTLGDRPFGELKISVPVVFAHGFVNKWLPEFVKLYPDITLKVDVSDLKADLISEGFDLLVRIGTLPTSDFMTRILFHTAMITIASPGYLEEHGYPRHPHELANHSLIDFSIRTLTNTWSFQGPERQLITVGVSPIFFCNDASMEKAMAMAGSGITRLPMLACEAELQSGTLVRILRQFEPDPAPVQLVFPSKKNLPAKTRAMIDFLVARSS
jgi:DNA-binding transcriptional LysR family regulator